MGYNIVTRTGNAGAGSGAGARAVESKAGGMSTRLAAMDLTDDEGRGAALAGAGSTGPAAPGRVLFKAKRQAEVEADAREFQQRWGDWLAAIAKDSPPENPDFSKSPSAGDGISRAAAGRVESKRTDGFDWKVGARKYGSSEGFFALAMDQGWLDRALDFIRKTGMDERWAAYYLEMPIEEYRLIRS